MFQRLLKLLGLLALSQSRNNSLFAQITPDHISGDSHNLINAESDFDLESQSNNICDNSLNIDPIKSLELKKAAEAIFAQDRSNHAIDALSLVDQAINLNPKGEWLNFDKGTYLSSLKRYEEAITAFSAEIALGHSSESISRSYLIRAFVHADIKNFKQASADIEAASNNDEEKLLSQQIKSFYQSYSKQLAREIRLETLQAHEKDSAAKIEELIKTTKEIAIQDSLSISTFGTIAGINLSLAQEKTVKPHHTYKLSKYSTSNPLYENANLGIENFENRDYVKAIICFTNQIATDHLNWEIFYLRGITQLIIEDNVWAIMDFDNAIELARRKNSNVDLLYHHRGIALINLGLFEEALNDFNTQMTINPNSESVIFRGILNKHLGHLEEAKKDFESYPEISLNEIKKDFPLMHYFAENQIAITSLCLFCSAVAAIVVFNQRIQQELRNAQPQNEVENNQIHRTNKEEIRGAIKQLSESIFTYLDISEEQKKSLAEISPQQIKEICKDLSQARSANEISEIFSQKYNEKISPELAEFFENIYSQSIANKTTTNSTNGYPVNFVYNAAIKSERAVSAINQNKLKEYVKIFDELINEGVETEIAKSATEIVLTEMVSTLVRNLEQQSSVENQIPQTAVTTSEISNLNSQQEGKTL